MFVYRDSTNESESSLNQAWRKPLRVAGIFLAISALYFGSTYAANINLGVGGNLEFGQGIQVTAACAGNTPLSLTPGTSFANASNGGSFKFSTISLANIPSSCRGVVFHFTSYGETSTAPLSLASNSLSTASVFMKSDSTFQVVSNSNEFSVQTLSSSSFKLTILAPASNANLIYRLTVESKNGDCSSAINCAIGDTGPGGGIIFMIPSTSGNTTGKYFEVAPTDASSNTAMCAPSIVVGLGLNNAIGYGETNSALINANNDCNGSPYAVYSALNYSTAGATDWYLPSREELKAVKDFAAQYIQISASPYMSSSENAANGSWFIDFGSTVSCGGGYWPACTTYKGQSGYKVRAVRSFVGIN